MGRYVIRRLLQTVVTFGVVMFLLHYLMTLAIQINGNPVRTFFGDKPVSESVLQATTAKFGLDDPCLTRVGDPCLGIFQKRMGDWFLHADFGSSYKQVDVMESIGRAIPVTLQLFAIVTLVWILFGITAGTWAALRRGKFIDYLVRIGTTLTVAVPGFLLLIVVQKVVGVILGNWARDTFGRDSVLGIIMQPSYNAKYSWLTLLVPGIVLGVFGIAGITRLSRTSMLENLRSDFVRTAKAKGLRPRRVTVVHTLRNSLIPVVTLIGFTLADALGGALITEGIYNIPGMGKLAYDAIKTVDTPVVIAVTAISAIIYMLVNLLIDLLYAVLDPRIRYE